MIYQKRQTILNLKFLVMDFSKKTLSNLSKKGISVLGSVAVPAFEGDVYFSGTAYSLVWNEMGFIRTHSQILGMAASSWIPETDPELSVIAE